MVMASVKITTKRQATLPKGLCDEMGLTPGDSLRVERRVVDGESLWVLLPKRNPWSWAGRAKKYGMDKSHDLAEIGHSVGRARSKRSY